MFTIIHFRIVHPIIVYVQIIVMINMQLVLKNIVRLSHLFFVYELEEWIIILTMMF